MECLKENFVGGQVLDGRFITIAPLNHGSFGMVFLAKDVQTGDDVAIKCLTKPSPDSTTLVVDDRSEELHCHTRLGYHPNIVNLIHSFETASHTYLVLEYCSMGDLYEAIRVNRGPLETEHVRDFMLQLISAVEFMHSKGLYHRDIKPENIFLCQNGSMKLGDFGLAASSTICTEVSVGSDRYMAPEQYEPPITGYSPAKADIWSIGICLLNILFARNPFLTPTESDVLFADYVRDRQSLFDVFPNMSQDTFEILTNALTIDPEKRTLSGVRDAVLRTVSFTTDDESLDEFCTEDRDVVPASANREPLRTPSLQSPQVNQGDSFPWAQALHASPAHACRQLSAIPDTESYSEDLFPLSETAGTSWYSAHLQTPSMASVFDSSMGTSFKSSIARPRNLGYPLQSDPIPVSASLPTSSSKLQLAMSIVFGKGKRDQISKSWSDLWDEEESENEEQALQQRREQNSRTWSRESKSVHHPFSTSTGLLEQSTTSLMNSRSRDPADFALSTDSLPTVNMNHPDLENVVPMARPRGRSFRYTPQKSSTLDKWAALGDRRRNYRPKEEPPRQEKKPSFLSSVNWRRNSGPNRHRNPFLDKEWRRETPNVGNAPPSAEFVGLHEKLIDEDLDLVGGWHELPL
jgi:serine/threonine protein kinase